VSQLVVHVTGARPNFPKAAPVLAALSAREGVEQLLVHTGQHYDDKMSDIFFRQLGIPKPDVNLGVGSGAHGRQTAAVMIALEGLFEERTARRWSSSTATSTRPSPRPSSPPRWGSPSLHVEAGLRSFDMTMPEEINRLVTDRLSDLLLTTSVDAVAHLGNEGDGSRRRSTSSATR
jgi:UDP-N-acetylglucosamine 2-epimerase (non-hydrolysing)